MPFLRPCPSFVSSAFHIRPSSRSIIPALSAHRATTAISAQRFINPATATSPTTSIRTYASQDYGSGQGDPKGENPQEQGSNPSADIEHPGPPPPTAGQGSGSGPTKGTSGGHNSGKSPSAPGSGGSQTGNQTQTQSQGSGSASGSGSGSGKTGKGAQPKILRDSQPAEPDEDVKQHNWELSQRADRAHEKLDDDGAEKEKVPKGYWSGECILFS